MTIPKSSQIKREAREAMVGQTGTAIKNEIIAMLLGGGGTIWTLIGLIVYSIIILVQLVLKKEIISDAGMDPNTVLLIVGGVIFGAIIIAFVRVLLKYGLDIGLNKFCIDMAAHPEKDARNQLFKNVKYFSNMMSLDFIRTIKVSFWSIFIFIPGIIASIKWVMADYVMSDDPTMSAGEAMIESEQLIEGYKFRYFKYSLTFIPWALLCLVTFGLAAFWVIPYIRTCNARFYYYLKNPIKDSSDEDEEEMVTLKADKFSYEDFLKEYHEKHPETNQRTVGRKNTKK